MFTGIIEEVGAVLAVRRNGANSDLVIQANTVLEGTNIGDSISVNGICLTVTKIDRKSFTADVMNETLRRSSLSQIKSGDFVNLERAMKCDGRFGGHIVSGHVDGTGTIVRVKREGIAVWYTIEAPENIMRFIVEKGSIAIDGISLTVATVEKKCFSVSIIPHTAKETTLSQKQAGDMVNLENDIVGKYVERLLTFENKEINREKENERWKTLCTTW